jgi:hypothetical protein
MQRMERTRSEEGEKSQGVLRGEGGEGVGGEKV